MRSLTPLEILINDTPERRESARRTIRREEPKALYGLPQDVRFCKRCVISNQRPSSTVEYSHVAESKKQTIQFDEEGVCDACRVAEAKGGVDWGSRERELRRLCDAHRLASGYDCIVPGSGGKDSYFAAHVLKHRYGMHPLLVTWASHIYTDWGWKNLQRWQEISDHTLATPRRDTHRLLTRLAVENLFHPFQPFIIGQKALAPKLAALYKIPLVFYGENEAEYGNPIATNTAIRDDEYFSTAKSGLTHLGGVSVHELIARKLISQNDAEVYMPAEPRDLRAAGVQVHYLGYYLKWHPQSAYYYAVEHGDFEAAPERTPGTYSKYNSIDDKLDDLHYWTTYQKFGIGRATYDAAQEIRSGDITREEGVSLVRRFDGEYPERFEEEVLRYLSVPRFVPASRGWLMGLAEKFRSDHLWKRNKEGAWELRHTVWGSQKD